MRTYELMLVFRPDLELGDEKKTEAAIKKFLGPHSVKIKDVTDMGKKHLAYPIKKLMEGHYIVATLESDGIKVGDIEKQARLQTDVIRYLLTVK